MTDDPRAKTKAAQFELEEALAAEWRARRRIENARKALRDADAEETRAELLKELRK